MLIKEYASQTSGLAFEYFMNRRSEPIINRKIKVIILQNPVKVGNQKNEKLL